MVRSHGSNGMRCVIQMTWPMYRHAECRFNGRLLQLTRMEAEVLSVLLLHRGCPLTPTDLIEAVYPDADFEPDTARNCVSVFMGRLRKKLPSLIQWHGFAQGKGFQGWLIERDQPMRMAA
jgi:DNA-binding response OmpR family regulator